MTQLHRPRVKYDIEPDRSPLTSADLPAPAPGTKRRVIRGEVVAVAHSGLLSPSFVHLDMARGLAALLVLLGHLRSFLFVPYGELKSHTAFEMIVWALSGLGHQAVMVFFVLSGFFICRSIVADQRRNGFEWGSYLIKRLTRLWIVLLPALLLTLLWDMVGARVAGPSFYEGHLYSIYSSGPDSLRGGENLQPPTFFGNLLFLQTIVTPIFGSNGPLWSLANEFWYYILFPVLYVAARRPSLASAFAHLALFVGIGCFVGPYIMLSGLIWLAGAVAYVVHERGWLGHILSSGVVLVTALAIFLISLCVTEAGYGSDFIKDLLIGLTSAILVLTLARREMRSTTYHQVARALANCSYSVYLVHFPFLAMLVNVALHNQKFGASVTGYALFASFGIVTLIYCYVVYWLFERHTSRVRRCLLTKYTEIVSRSVVKAQRCSSL